MDTDVDVAGTRKLVAVFAPSMRREIIEDIFLRAHIALCRRLKMRVFNHLDALAITSPNTRLNVTINERPLAPIKKRAATFQPDTLLCNQKRRALFKLRTQRL